MRIRLIGAADLVRGWARRLEALGFVGKEYDARGAGQLRWYGDIDDRLAARIDPRQEPLDFAVSDNRDKKRARKVQVSAAETQAAGLAPTMPAPPPRRLGRGKR